MSVRSNSSSSSLVSSSPRASSRDFCFSSAPSNSFALMSSLMLSSAELAVVLISAKATKDVSVSDSPVIRFTIPPIRGSARWLKRCCEMNLLSSSSRKSNVISWRPSAYSGLSLPSTILAMSFATPPLGCSNAPKLRGDSASLKLSSRSLLLVIISHMYS